MLGSRSRLLNFDLSTTPSIPICASSPSALGLDSLIRFRTSAAVATPVRLSLKRASRNFRTGCIYVLSSFAPISTFSISCLCKEVLAQPCKTESLGFRNTHCINRNWWLDLDTARKARTDFIDHPFNRTSDSLPLSLPRLAPPPPFCYRKGGDQPGTPMPSFALPHPSRNLLAPLAVVTAA